MRIGIFSGTFDPVHKGHIAFALEAMKKASLDEVYFMPEAKPRRKEGMTHYAHRLAMLEIALKPYPKLKIYQTPDKQFTVSRTMPRLKKDFRGSQIFLLLGSDMAAYLTDAGQWPNAETLLKEFGIIIGLRGDTSEEEVKAQLSKFKNDFIIVSTDKKHASSRSIRKAAASNVHHKDSLRGTKNYMKQNWLYDSIGDSASIS